MENRDIGDIGNKDEGGDIGTRDCGVRENRDIGDIKETGMRGYRKPGLRDIRNI